MAFECADIIILSMRILIKLGYKNPLEIITEKGEIIKKDYAKRWKYITIIQQWKEQRHIG